MPAEVRAPRPIDEVTLLPAVFHVSPDKLHLDLNGRIEHRAATELTLLRLAVTLKNAGGATLGTLSIEASPDFEPLLRPGDSRTFYLSEEVPAQTASVEITEATRNANPSPPSYGEGQAIPVTFEPPAPAHFALAAAWRARESRRYEGKSTVEGVIEVTNTGKGVIRSLDIQLVGLDAAGRPVDKPANQTVAYPIMAPMQPGERRVVRGFLYVPGEVVSERVVVSAIQ